MDPTHADVAYGENERHRVDLYLADSGQPTPLYLHIHGGGFRRGDKSGVGQCLVNGLAESGISIASMNYRFSGTNPFPASFEDGVRAIQFLRYKADEYNLDRERFAAGGGSAGGGITFYVGYKPDRSDPNSTDPVCRESSLLQCIAANDTQSSYDCNYIKTIISGLAYRNTALLELFQVTTDEFDTDRAIEQFYSSSALNHVTTDAPPTCVSFFRFDLQMTDNLSSGDGIHHPIFGRVLKERMDELGVRCDIYYREDLGDMDEGEAKAALADKRMIFLREHLL
ncbi:MAG: alpha/beta hydrolase [Candidatus Latescibacterota bacterium]|nr:alpha/beta hydrolase [Candidatus Latescibacterota bacterium]